MSTETARFVWYELMTNDMKAAETFYGSVLGWTMRDSGLPGPAYTLFFAGETGVGGITGLSGEALTNGAMPGWVGYVGVEDVDAVADKVVAAKGKVLRKPDDIPDVGRFAVIADPQGAVFLLFRGKDGAMPPAKVPPATPGIVGWHELHATDWRSAFSFYSGLFGWTRDSAIDMGAMGIYQLFATGGPAVGGMMNKMESEPRANWQYVFNVENIHAGTDRVKQGGGKVLFGPSQVPGGSWVTKCFDPEGVLFTIVGPA